MKMAKDVPKPVPPVEPQVTINGGFLREQTREAVQQFFRPLIAPFEKGAPSPKDAPKRRAG